MTEGALNERINALRERLTDAEKDTEKLCLRVEALEKSQRWMLGAATGIGAMLPIALPKLAQALGIGS